jgi:hypothetical protein
VDVMSASGQFLPQFRGDDAGTAIGWVTSDANPHIDPLFRDRSLHYQRLGLLAGGKPGC